MGCPPVAKINSQLLYDYAKPCFDSPQRLFSSFDSPTQSQWVQHCSRSLVPAPLTLNFHCAPKVG